MRFFVLGANDPEMQEIEHILKEQGERFTYAMKDGKRCHPGNAYFADVVEIPEDAGGGILIECQPADIEGFYRIDHHRKGDLGYDLPLEMFLEASSIGQLCEMFGITPTHEQIVLAAMDHCPAAAIVGKCPGVSAEEVLQRKISESAKGTNTSEIEMQALVHEYTKRIHDASYIRFGSHGVRDLRNYDLGEGYSRDLMAMQIAALAGGYTVLLKHHDPGDTREKWSISGHASKELIKKVIRTWKLNKKLTGIYGVPSRGYAGVYVK